MVEICECCGAKVVKYWHSLNKGLCAALIRVYKMVGQESAKISHILTHNQLCNFQKLKYWGLVEKVKDEDFKGGTWKVTRQGAMFVKGEISMHKRVQTFRGKFTEGDMDWKKIKDIVEGYQYRPDYAREAE